MFYVIFLIDFNPRSSCEERPGFGKSLTFSCDFNPRSSCEERHKTVLLAVQYKQFQSTLLMRGATCIAVRLQLFRRISIHAPHARSDIVSTCVRLVVVVISIHAPHARSDTARRLRTGGTQNFNPRSSCEERHQETCREVLSYWLFQSTLLMRGATGRST